MIPPQRYAHSAVVKDRFIYIFGGYSEKFGWLNDLHVLDTGIGALPYARA